MKKAILLYLSVLTAVFAVTVGVFHWRCTFGSHPLPQPDTPRQIQKINLNTATAQQLQQIPGVGPALSEKIINYRTVNGPFTSVEDLLNVDGIGIRTLTKFLTYATVGESP